MTDNAVQNHNDSPPQSTTRSQNAELQPMSDFLDYVEQYAREKPEVCALWCLGVGFVLGWKLKPW